MNSREDFYETYRNYRGGVNEFEREENVKLGWCFKVACCFLLLFVPNVSQNYYQDYTG